MFISPTARTPATQLALQFPTSLGDGEETARGLWVRQFTVDNPTMYSRPWTATLPMRTSDGPIYEYACHEGNYALAHVLSGFRAQEKAAEEAAKQNRK